MSDHQNNHHQEENNLYKKPQSPWHGLKRIHHSWIFWIFAILMFAAITFYIVSNGFSLVSKNHMVQPIESPVAP